MLRLVSYQKAVPRPIQPLFHSKGDGKEPFYLFISKSKMSCSKRFLKGFSCKELSFSKEKQEEQLLFGCLPKKIFYRHSLHGFRKGKAFVKGHDGRMRETLIENL